MRAKNVGENAGGETGIWKSARRADDSWTKLILARVSIIAQLSLPTERSRFGSDLLGLGDKTLLLIEHREARVSQFVIWRDGDQSLAQIDGFIELPQMGIRHG